MLFSVKITKLVLNTKVRNSGSACMVTARTYIHIFQESYLGMFRFSNESFYFLLHGSVLRYHLNDKFINMKQPWSQLNCFQFIFLYHDICCIIVLSGCCKLHRNDRKPTINQGWFIYICAGIIQYIIVVHMYSTYYIVYN